MPTYVPLFARDLKVDDHPIPDIADFRFRCPDDVVEYARHERTIGATARPEVWHLDRDGRFHCYYEAPPLAGIRRWGEQPHPLHCSRWQGIHSPGGCAPNWLIVESRPCRRGDPTPTEGDVAAFVAVRADLEWIGVNLVDAVIFDDACHWWSMHDLEHQGQPYELRAASDG